MPKQKIIEEEFRLMNKLKRYDNSVLAFTANEIECSYNPTRFSTKKTILTSLRCIGVLPLAVFAFTAAIILYYNRPQTYSLSSIGLWIIIVLTVFLIVTRVLNFLLEFKEKHCVYLIRQAVWLKEKNMSEKELQLLFDSVRDIMVEARAEKIEGGKLLSLFRRVISQKEKKL